MEIENYYEKNLVINSRTLEYKGIFRREELFQVINQVLREKGYEKREKKNEELVTPEGRKIYLELRPYKEVSDYVILMIKIKLTLDKVTEVVEEVEGVKKKFDRGDIEVVFDAWSLTDYRHRWGMKPIVYFLKGMIHKFVYTFPLERKFRGTLVEDTAYIYAHIKKYLNSFQREEEKRVSEEEVRQKVKEEMEKEMKERKFGEEGK